MQANLQKRHFWLLALAVLLLVCLASPLFFAPLWSAGSPERGAGLPDLADALRVDLNTATLEQLCTLPGIGEVRAAAILEYRQAHGLFSALEDVMMVKGISERIVEGWGDLAYVS